MITLVNGKTKIIEIWYQLRSGLINLGLLDPNDWTTFQCLAGVRTSDVIGGNGGVRQAVYIHKKYNSTYAPQKITATSTQEEIKHYGNQFFWGIKIFTQHEDGTSIYMIEVIAEQDDPIKIEKMYSYFIKELNIFPDVGISTKQLPLINNRLNNIENSNNRTNNIESSS